MPTLLASDAAAHTAIDPGLDQIARGTRGLMSVTGLQRVARYGPAFAIGDKLAGHVDCARFASRDHSALNDNAGQRVEWLVSEATVALPVGLPKSSASCDSARGFRPHARQIQQAVDSLTLMGRNCLRDGTPIMGVLEI